MHDTPPTLSGVSVEGAVLVVARHVEHLPERCVYCGARSDGKPITRRHAWHAPWWYLTIVLGLLVYVLIAMGIRQRHRLVMHLCPEHKRERMTKMLAGYIGAPAAAVGLCFIMPRESEAFALGAMCATLLGLGGMLYASRADGVLRVRRIERERSLFLGASPALVRAHAEDVAEVFG